MRLDNCPQSVIVDSSRRGEESLLPYWRQGKLKTRCLILIAIFGLSLVLFGHFMAGQALAQSDAKSQAQLYFFTDHGCAPCRQVEPGIEALKLEGYPVKTVFLSQQRELGRRFGVDRTPTVVLLADNQMAGRHAGLIDAVTLKKWFAAVGVSAGTKFAQASDEPVGGTKIVMDGKPSLYSGGKSRTGFSTPTMLKGTASPRDANERLALQATVKLKVEDPEGISYATGTVIHSHQGESLVMTCGHVFREAGEDGAITAEYGFDKRKLKTAPGQLIFFDADARDIALVAIRTSQKIEPVSIAARETKVEPGEDIFSIGCDHGEDPTIRHSRIKNRAAYDGAIKYDIFGRPVDGRSGGGLFNERGELIGVCNAAAVEVDEGIYTALDTLHWQLAKVNLEHLFEGSATLDVRDLANSDVQSNLQPQSRLPVIRPKSELVALNAPRSSAALRSSATNGLGRTPVAWARPAPVRDSRSRNSRSGNSKFEQEVIIIVRSKTDPGDAQAITVSDPGPQLLDYLKTMKSQGARATRQLDMAQMRELN